MDEKFYINSELCDAGNGEYTVYEISRGDCIYMKVYDKSIAEKLLKLMNAGLLD